MKSYTELIDNHRGRKAFVLGAGPSLYEVFRHPLFNRIFNHVVISVNSSIMVTPWRESFNYFNNSFWISNDSLCRRWVWWKDVLNSNCRKIVRDSWLPFEKELDGFYYFSPRPTSEGKINLEDKGLSYCSSVPSGVDLALQMGCSEVYMLGVDHKRDGKYEHFWQFMDNTLKVPRGSQGPWKQREQVFNINKEAFKALNFFAEKKNSKIINLITKKGSNVNEFEKIHFSKIIEKV